MHLRLPGERLRPVSVAGLTRGLTGYFGLMRQLLVSLGIDVTDGSVGMPTLFLPVDTRGVCDVVSMLRGLRLALNVHIRRSSPI